MSEQRRFSEDGPGRLYDRVTVALRASLASTGAVIDALDALRELELRARALDEVDAQKSSGGVVCQP